MLQPSASSASSLPCRAEWTFWALNCTELPSESRVTSTALSGFGSIRASNLVARQAVEQAAVNTLDAARNISVEDRRDVGPRRLADGERAKDRVRHRLSLRRAERDDAGGASSRTAH